MNANRHVLWISFLLTVTTFVSAENSAVPSLNIVPRPVSVKPLAGTFILNDQTRVLAVDNESRRIAGLFSEFLLNQHGFHLRTTTARPKGGNYISFSHAASSGLPEEGYRLVISAESIRVTGQPAGLFYGMQTLTQLLPLDLKPAIVLPALEITDSRSSLRSKTSLYANSPSGSGRSDSADKEGSQSAELAAPAMENEADLRKVRREIEYRELNMTESKLANLRHCILLDHHYFA